MEVLLCIRLNFLGGLYRDTEQISFSNPEDAWPFWGEGVDIAHIPVECGVMVCVMAGGAGAKVDGLLVSFLIRGVIDRWWPHAVCHFPPLNLTIPIVLKPPLIYATNTP